MASSPWEGLKRAKANILVITRSRARRITARGRPLARMLSECLLEVFALVGVTLIVATTRMLHPVAGLYSLGAAGLGWAWLVALARRPEDK